MKIKIDRADTRVELELSQREMNVLVEVLGRTTGAYSGPRGFTSKLWSHLVDAGAGDRSAAKGEINLPHTWEGYE